MEEGGTYLQLNPSSNSRRIVLEDANAVRPGSSSVERVIRESEVWQRAVVGAD